MDSYSEKILYGKIDSCEFVKLAVQRQQDDLLKQRTDDFPYYFDETAGLRAVKFFKLLRHYKGKWAGQKFIPSEWQVFILSVFYGWKRVGDNKRRFKYSYIEVPKKNGKSTFSAGKALYNMLADGEASPEIYIAAAKEAQARICLDAAREIGKRTPEVNKRLNIYNYEIKKPDDGGVMRALGSDSKKQDGLNISVGIIDEYHTHPTDDMYDILKQGCGAREQPVIDIITTAGYDKSYPCYDFRDHCIKVLRGVTVQDNLFTIIYTIDEDDDWKDPKCWRKANPNWEIINQTDFKDEAEMAISRNSEEPKFKTKRLCVWTDSVDVWVKDEDWMECAGEEIDLTEFDCYGGLDIAATVDINAFVLLFVNKDRFYVKPFFWIPEKKVKENEDRVNYWKWKEDGLINVMTGDALDDEFMARDMLDIIAKYKVKGIAFDRYYSGGIIGRLEKAGFDMNKLSSYGQGYVSMSGPIREMERRIGLRNLDHFGNPVLRWMCSNISLSMDAAGNVKFDKSKRSDKIDGMVALAMAIAMEQSHEKTEEFTGKILIV